MEVCDRPQNANAWVAKLADAPDLGSGWETSAGSSPVTFTVFSFHGRGGVNPIITLRDLFA